MAVKSSLIALLSLSFIAGAQEGPQREQIRDRAHVVRASGEATVTAKPDRAIVSISVFNQAANAQAASEQNAAGTARVLEAIKKALGSAGQVKTAGYSISPEYQYANGRPPKVTGYNATNTINVTIDDLELPGKVIDAAIAAGANRIEGISFTLKNDEAVRAQALAEAATRARANAEAIAHALNVRIVGVLEAESIQPVGIRPLAMQAFSRSTAGMAAEVPTPIEPTSVDVHASVMVALEVQ